MPVSKARAFIARHWQHLMQIRDTPHAIAGGLALGLMLGFTPLLGFKTLLAVLLAWFFRCSKLSAAVAVTFHDVLIPFWPVLLRWQYNLGYWLLSHPHHLPPRFGMKQLHLENWVHWKTLHVLWPTLLGSIIMAVPMGIVCYFVTLKVVTRYQEAKAKQALAQC